MDQGLGLFVASAGVGKSLDNLYWVDIDNFDFFKGLY